MKKVIILGAGIYQVPLIKTSKKNNFYTIVVSIPGNYPGFAIADQIAYLDTTDYLAVFELAKKEHIDAILTTGTDVAMITVGYVCEQLGLRGISYKSAKLVTDKAMMKDAFVKGNVRTANYKTVSSLEDAKIASEDIGYPVMVKIVDKSGSRGITRVNSEESLKEAYEYGKRITQSDHMIIEKYIEAHEIGVEVFVQDNEIKFFLPHDKLVYKTKRTGIPRGHICPLDLSTKLYEDLYLQTELTIKALELDNCAVNMDVFVSEEDGVYVIEATGRCGATGIPEVVSAYTKMDYYQVMLDNAMGKKVKFNNEHLDGAVASALLFSERTGILKSIHNTGNLQRYESICFDYNPGQFITAVEDGTDRIGMAIFRADNREQLLKRIDCFDKDIVIDVE